VVDPRFVRQVLVAEIGERGQAAILRATARTSGQGLAAEVAARYAARAGFREIADGGVEVTAPGYVVEPAARAVVEGALSALAAIVAATR